jgi:hypothetical protein
MANPSISKQSAALRWALAKIVKRGKSPLFQLVGGPISISGYDLEMWFRRGQLGSNNEPVEF